jgi:hypothetical protein
MSTAMVNSRDKTMGSTGGRRANASMTEKLALHFTEIAVEGGQNSGSLCAGSLRLGQLSRIRRLASSQRAFMTRSTCLF